MTGFMLPEHKNVVAALQLLDGKLLERNKCWFGGGTAIVLKFGEYRVSLDVDFLCSDPDGYRELRSAAVQRGHRAFFSAPVQPIREFRVDQYGLRTAVSLNGQTIKFEIVREGRIGLSGEFDNHLAVPILTVADMFAEKLLANADRCQDRAVGYRDAIDLGMLILDRGAIPDEAIAKAEAAYGTDVGYKVRWVTDHLASGTEVVRSAEALRMDPAVADRAIGALRREGTRLWPDLPAKRG